MKNALFIFGLCVALGTAAFGQAQNSGSADPQPVRGKSVKTENKANSGRNTGPKTASNSGNTSDAASLLQAGTGLEAELQSVIDVRKNAVGDEVVLKTTKSIKQNGEVIVPKGTNLVGRITEVQKKSKESSVSRVGMVFDRIQGKGVDAPVNLSIVSMFAAKANAAASDLFAADATAMGSGSGAVSRPTTNGGGLLGGVGSAVNTTLGTATNAVGNVASAATGTVSGTVNQTTGGLGRTLNGLQLSNSLSGSAASSSTISAQGKDVKVEKGTTFLLKVDGSAQDQE